MKVAMTRKNKSFHNLVEVKRFFVKKAKRLFNPSLIKKRVR